MHTKTGARRFLVGIRRCVFIEQTEQVKLVANRYNVKYDGKPLALAHVLPHPRYAGQLMISVIPHQKTSDSGNGTHGNRMRTALYGNCPDTKPDIEAILELVASAGFEPEKVVLTPVGRR